MGECWKVRELLDFGESTVPGAALRPTVRVAREVPVALVVVIVAGAAEGAVGFMRFLGFSRIFVGLAFSLSDRTSL